jgi:hypothetical protein
MYHLFGENSFRFLLSSNNSLSPLSFTVSPSLPIEKMYHNYCHSLSLIQLFSSLSLSLKDSYYYM